MVQLALVILIVSSFSVAGYSFQILPAAENGLIARNSDGSISMMDQAAATQYCKSHTMHLPSARELAQLAISLGAVEIAEAPLVHYSVNAINADGSTDKFYHRWDSTDYKRPRGDVGKNWFWSSSIAAYDNNLAYALNMNYGYVDHGKREIALGVWCFANQ